MNSCILHAQSSSMYRISILSFVFAVLFASELTAQLNDQSIPVLPSDPQWVSLLYSPTAHPTAIRAAYEAWFASHPFKKSRHTQAYKRWLSLNRHYFTGDGSLVIPDHEERARQEERKRHADQSDRGDIIWSYAGPVVHYDADGSLTEGFRHSNIYCHDRSVTNTNLLYCGTESGGAYKSIDAGQHWTHVTQDHIIGDVGAIRIHPTEENIVLMSAANDLWRTTDGGNTWQVIGQPSFVSQNIRAWEIAFSHSDPNTIYAACNLGFFRSTDGGDNWSEVLQGQCKTIAIKPDDESVIYTIQEENSSLSKFYKSTDYGATWTIYDNGWFDNSGNITPEGGRLATTAADPNRIYAILVGYQNDQSTITTNGWIGAWVSYDAGETWTFPHGQIGTPYTAEHPNLMNFTGDDGDYTQINYNTTLIASQINPDVVLIGGLNLWKSTDACATYEGVGGYIGGIDYFHVDQQEYRIYQTGPTTEEIWFSNDGGIGWSGDFMENHNNLNHGIQAVNLWGYDQGWNEDMMVGGRYHNGNMAYHELYPAGEFLAMGGGEAATGYVNYSDENRTYHSDIGGYIIPNSLDGTSQSFSTTLYPNESYWNNNSSRIMFDNTYYNVAWLGRDHMIYKSENGAATFGEVHAFGSSTDSRVLWIEQSYADYRYIYLHQGVGSSSVLWRTTDHGESWEELNLPETYRDMNFTLSATNPDELWISFYYAPDDNKVYHTIDGGQNWENLSTAILNGLEIWAMAHQYGTDGGVYLAIKNGQVYYRNNNMDDWTSYSAGLPASAEPIRIVPFYKGNKIRLATWNLGVWEANLFEPSSLMADFAAEQRSFFCPGDSMHFVDHSVVGEGAVYNWTFPGATPSSSNEKNPTVVYATNGTYDVTLTVEWNAQTQTVTKQAYISELSGVTDILEEDFESGSYPEFWILQGNGSWNVNADASAYDAGQYSMRFDNYYYDAQGARDEIWLGKYNTGGLSVALTFDKAYAEYGPPYTDTLAVLFSIDCGATWTEIWVQGGDDLATHPDLTDFYVPAGNEWENVPLTFVPQSDEIIIAFQNRGHYGNAIYVDNINVVTYVSVAENEILTVLKTYPNPVEDYCVIEIANANGEQLQLEVFDALGKVVFTETHVSSGVNTSKKIDTTSFAPGIYYIHLKGDQTDAQTRFVVK
ncbi:MAG: T9SS type A sorting domain-containing protein [Flavobacteriales bacterium]|nr:T9SS type A sorting domain-containing protein [Flavobacteriales bacterium]